MQKCWCTATAAAPPPLLLQQHQMQLEEEEQEQCIFSGQRPLSLSCRFIIPQDALKDTSPTQMIRFATGALYNFSKAKTIKDNSEHTLSRLSVLSVIVCVSLSVCVSVFLCDCLSNRVNKSATEVCKCSLVVRLSKVVLKTCNCECLTVFL